MRKEPNPVARAMAINRRRSQVVAPKKGKGSYNRKKDSTHELQRDRSISEDKGEA